MHTVHYTLHLHMNRYMHLYLYISFLTLNTTHCTLNVYTNLAHILLHTANTKKILSCTQDLHGKMNINICCHTEAGEAVRIAVAVAVDAVETTLEFTF